MPNNCSNKLTMAFVSNEAAEAFNNELQSTDDQLFKMIHPMPSTVYAGPLGNAEREEHGTNNWHDWNTTNWGTKWEAYDLQSELVEDQIILTFRTAWSPPEALMHTAQQRDDIVSTLLLFSEAGCDFMGYHKTHEDPIDDYGFDEFCISLSDALGDHGITEEGMEDADAWEDEAITVRNRILMNRTGDDMGDLSLGG